MNKYVALPSTIVAVTGALPSIEIDTDPVALSFTVTVTLAVVP